METKLRASRGGGRGMASNAGVDIQLQTLPRHLINALHEELCRPCTPPERLLDVRALTALHLRGERPFCE